MYNEEMNAEKCIREMSRVTQKNPGVKLFIVNDGSKDQTAKIVRALKTDTQLEFEFVDNSINGGYGKACLSGAQEAHKAGYEFGVFMDSDLTNDPELISVFVEVIKTGKYDMIKASRYVQGGGMSGVPWNRQLITIVGNWVASLLFNVGVRDCTNGFRAVRLKLMTAISFQETGFPMILEELYNMKKMGARMTEVPYTLTARQEGGGASKFNYSAKVIWSYFRYALLALFVSHSSNERKMNVF